MSPRRHFVRCCDCLAISAIEGRPPADLECECGGKVQDMGAVKGERLAAWTSQTPCDARCTGARGPNCDCPCLGVNHGTGRLVTVQHDKGPVPRISSPSPERAAEYRAAFRAATEAHWSRYGRLIEAKRRGEWIADFSSYLEAQYYEGVIAKAARGKTHGGRLKALRELAAVFSGAARS